MANFSIITLDGEYYYFGLMASCANEAQKINARNVGCCSVLKWMTIEAVVGHKLYIDNQSDAFCGVVRDCEGGDRAR